MILSLHIFNYFNCLIVNFHHLLLGDSVEFLKIALYFRTKIVGLFERLAEVVVLNGRKIAFILETR